MFLLWNLLYCHEPLIMEPSRKPAHTTNQDTCVSDLVIEGSGKTICACVRATMWFPTNQYLESPLWLTNQVAAAIPIYSPVSCAQTHFPGRLPASPLVRSSPLSL